MSKSNVFENDFLKLIFQGEAIAYIADDAASDPLTDLFFSLHTADPGEAGDQETNEVSYTPYERVAVERSASGFAVTGNVVNPVDDVDFPICASGTATATHFAIGTHESGTGKILYKGALTPNIVISAGVPPTIRKESTITED